MHCGQTVGRIKMKLGVQAGLGPDHTVLDGDPAPPRKGAQLPPRSKFTGAGFACVRIIRGPCLLWPNSWMDQDETSLGGRHRPSPNCVKWEPSSHPPKGHSTAPKVSAMSVVASSWMDQDAAWYGGRPRSKPHCAIWGPTSPPPKGHTPIFGPCLVWLNGRPSQLLLSTCMLSCL